ncbi:MAG: hypothetical protein J3R72DRAFT_83102 [Linnemannia gamsii]|nr:MAG: hypothetical protein J3R72DRAFT_83102 [Linnemannia gamsii]
MDEDMVIISRLEREPWQPDLLLERQSDKTTSSTSNPFASSSPPTTTAQTNKSTNGEATTSEPITNNESTTTATTTAALSGGFQGVIPVIIKSPSSVITTADSDCVDSIFEDLSPKIPGIQEYLQQTHQEQLLLQQQRLQHQQEVQLHLQYQLPAHLAQQQQQQQTKINHPNIIDATINTNTNTNANTDSTTSTRTNNDNNSTFTRRQTSQQYRNSFHGHSAPFLLGLDEHRSSLISRPSSIHEPQAIITGSESPLTKVMTDNEVIGSNCVLSCFTCSCASQ